MHACVMLMVGTVVVATPYIYKNALTLTILLNRSPTNQEVNAPHMLKRVQKEVRELKKKSAKKHKK